MYKRAYYMVNAITFYRMVAAPLLLLLVINHQLEVFRWLLAVSFFTDAIDGFLARRYKVSSAFGARLDSIADDLTIAAGIAGMLVFKSGFIEEHLFIIILLLILFVVQIGISFIRYRKMTSFHTYGAKVAAIFQGVFLILLFFLPQPLLFLFYLTAAVTAIELVEEIIIVIMLPEWETDVKGLYWVIRRQNR
ncbi:MAG TPA: CDP-alcohol phosphatidyltransferase family protein [Chitinophagaceae bacterium]